MLLYVDFGSLGAFASLATEIDVVILVYLGQAYVRLRAAAPMDTRRP